MDLSSRRALVSYAISVIFVHFLFALAFTELADWQGLAHVLKIIKSY